MFGKKRIEELEGLLRARTRALKVAEEKVEDLQNNLELVTNSYEIVKNELTPAKKKKLGL